MDAEERLKKYINSLSKPKVDDEDYFVNGQLDKDIEEILNRLEISDKNYQTLNDDVEMLVKECNANHISEAMDNVIDLKNRLEEARKYIKRYQKKDEFLEINEWQSRDLLKILGDD